MKRRDFIRFAALGVAGAALPVVLTAPVLGAGWKHFHITTYYRDLPSEAEVASHNLTVFARRMVDEGFTSIWDYSHEITRQRTRPDNPFLHDTGYAATLDALPDRFPPFTWVVEAQAKLR